MTTSTTTTMGSAVRLGGAALLHCVFALVFFAGFIKYSELSRFAESLSTWQLIPGHVHGVIAVAVPTVECMLGGLWFLRVRREFVVLATVGMLFAFTAVYVMHWTLVGAPVCECFGALAAFAEMQRSASGLVVRNGILIAMLIVGTLAGGVSVYRAPSPARSSLTGISRTPTQARGFTLVELLVTLAIIAIVVSLLIPHVASVRARAQNLQSTANLRSHVLTVSTYAGDYAESAPFLTDPRATYTVLRGGGEVVTVPFFTLFCSWNVGLADNYLGQNARHESLVVPWAARPWPFVLYFYGDTCITRPEYWRYESRRADGSQLRSTNLAEVLFPSQKGVIYELGWASGHRPSRDPGRSNVRFGLVDGSAREFRSSEIRSGYVYGSQMPGQSPPTGWGSALPVMGTIGGVHGRDTD